MGLPGIFELIIIALILLPLLGGFIAFVVFLIWLNKKK